MIIIYITCKNLLEAKKISKHLLSKKLCFCTNIFKDVFSMFLEDSKIEKSKESILILKTKKENFKKIEKEVLEIHSYDTPCIMALKVDNINKKYYNVLKAMI